jgi:class 3 adenylate cyclase/predicted ATPase
MVYRFHDYTLDPASRELWHGAQRLALEPKVLQVLLYLLEHRDRLVPKAELLEQCWPETFVSESALTRCLVRLRKAVLAPPAAPPVIETRHRQGYRFVAAVTVLSTLPSPATTDPTPSGRPTLQAAIRLGQQVAAEPALASAPLASTLLSGLAPARPASAERRQLTVLYCSVVDSATLAGQLDPEDFREIMGRYHATCTAVLQRYGGHVAQYLVDGLLGYFGWPQAHEDDTQRAVHAGLALVTAVHALGSELVQDFGLRLAIRIGIHTGLVVVGGGQEESLYGQLAAGATPKLAATIESLAAPDTVVIGATTYALVQGFFVCESLGEHVLPGTTAPTALYHVRGASGAHGRLDIVTPQQLTPFVGREVELAVLQERLAQVRQGFGQAVLVGGEPGMGKSRLVQQVKTALLAEGFTPLAYYGSPYTQHTALHPVVEWLQGSMHGNGDLAGLAPLARLEALVQQAGLDLSAHLPWLATLVNLDLPQERYPVSQLTPQRQRQRTLETLLALVLGLASQQPVLLIVEDLHWLDPTTLEWLGMVLDQGPTAPLCTLLTCRPTFALPWGSRTHLTHLTLPRLTPQQMTQIVQCLGGDRLSAAQVQHILAQTDGVPLFVEEVTKFILATQRLQGLPSHSASGSMVPEMAIPATLRDTLMARLDQLGPAKGTAQLGATIGRAFPVALLQAVTPLEEDVLRQDLQHLVEAELLYQRGVGATAVYQFKHALIQEAAYASLLRRRRQHYHQHIAQVLETQFPDLVATQPELLAQHYTEAALYDHAVPYWQQAGAQASARFAHQEAMRHLTTGLDVLARLPDTPERTTRELTLSIALAAPLLMTRGYAAADVAHTYHRVQQLCQQVGDAAQVFPALYGLCLFHLVRGECTTARQVGQQALELAQQVQTPDFMMLAHTVLGVVLFFCGEFATALEHLEQGFAPYDPLQHHALALRYGDDPGVFSLAYMVVTLLMLGYLDRAKERSNAAVALARQLGHPYSLAIPLVTAAVSSQFRREGTSVQVWAEAIIALATEHGFAHWLGAGMILRGWALAHQGHVHEGIEQLQQGLAAWRAVGAGLVQPYWLAILAEAYWWAGQLESGLHTVDAALVAGQHNQEPWWDAHLYWLKGELLLAQHGTHLPLPEAEACFQQALTIARFQQTRFLELRAAVSLARLWQQQGKQAEARTLLAPIYGWFTEGFDTADPQEARALLEQQI